MDRPSMIFRAFLLRRIIPILANKNVRLINNLDFGRKDVPKK